MIQFHFSQNSYTKFIKYVKKKVMYINLTRPKQIQDDNLKQKIKQLT